jgi:hypothetical protein
VLIDQAKKQAGNYVLTIRKEKKIKVQIFDLKVTTKTDDPESFKQSANLVDIFCKFTDHVNF